MQTGLQANNDSPKSRTVRVTCCSSVTSILTPAKALGIPFHPIYSALHTLYKTEHKISALALDERRRECPDVCHDEESPDMLL